MIDKLENLREPRNGEKIIHKAYKREEIYSGPYMEEAPDIVVLPSDNWEIYGGMQKTVFHFGEKRGWTTGNHPKGIFTAYGCDIRETGKVDGARIIDIAPTALHIMAVPIPSDMDGKVLDIFREHSGPVEMKVCYQDVDEREEEKELSREEEEAIKRRLQELGYLG